MMRPHFTVPLGQQDLEISRPYTPKIEFQKNRKLSSKIDENGQLRCQIAQIVMMLGPQEDVSLRIMTEFEDGI